MATLKGQSFRTSFHWQWRNQRSYRALPPFLTDENFFTKTGPLIAWTRPCPLKFLWARPCLQASCAIELQKRNKLIWNSCLKRSNLSRKSISWLKTISTNPTIHRNCKDNFTMNLCLCTTSLYIRFTLKKTKYYKKFYLHWRTNNRKAEENNLHQMNAKMVLN